MQLPTGDELAKLLALLPMHDQATRVVTYGWFNNGAGDGGAKPARQMVEAFPVLLAAVLTLRAELDDMRARAIPDKNWDTAVEWLINSGAASDMAIQDAFWMLSQGLCTEEEAHSARMADGRTISEARTAHQMEPFDV